MYSSSIRWLTATYRSASIRPQSADEPGVADRQDMIPGFDTAVLSRSRVLLVGAGGIGSEIATGLARKGVGTIRICDHDVVEVSNLSRQHFFEEDLHQPKALCLARNASYQGHLGSTCEGHHVAFDEESAGQLALGVDLAVVAVDSNASRAFASYFFRRQGIPVAFAATNRDANYAWVFLQETSGPCLGCVFPRMGAALGKREPCEASPAVLDILRAISGLVLYGVDSLLMGRPRNWNFRDLHVVGGTPDCVTTVRPRPGCRLCNATGD
jgi:molybdopterin/thiamine biosynthesis adenylyltransferase